MALEPVQGVGEGVQALLSDQLGNEQILFQFSNTATSFDDLLGRFNVGASYFNLRRRINYGGSVFHFAGDFLDEKGFRYFERRVGAAATISYPYTKFSRVEIELRHSLLRPGSRFLPAGPEGGSRHQLSFLHLRQHPVVPDRPHGRPPLPGDPRSQHRAGQGRGGRTSPLSWTSVGTSAPVFAPATPSGSRERSPRAPCPSVSCSAVPGPSVGIRGGDWWEPGPLLLNQEMRFPLLEGVAVGFPFGTIGFPPVQGALFLDTGQAWEEGETPEEVLGSFGLGLRTNLGGFLVLRLDFAKRTDFETINKKTEVDFFVGFNY